MRRQIRLTGRKQLPRSAFGVRIVDDGQRSNLTVVVNDNDAVREFPPTARIVAKLHENKLVEILELGTLLRPSVSAPITERGFVAPSCQIRLVADGGDASKKGLLLASTEPWTIKDGKPADPSGEEGILLFQPGDTAPLSWKLSVGDSTFPIVYIDRRIPNAGEWAKSDPVFLSCVLPAIVSQIFLEVLDSTSPTDIDWMAAWVKWSENIMPGGERLPLNTTLEDKMKWIARLIESFSSSHKLADLLLTQRLSDGA